MPHRFRFFAYPVLLSARPDGQVAITCRDLPELNMLLPPIAKVRLIAAAEALLDAVFEGYLNEGRPLPQPSLRDPGEHVVAPSPALIARAVKLADELHLPPDLPSAP